MAEMYGILTSDMPEFDPGKVPAAVRRAVGQTFYEAIAEAFQVPGIREEFERWQAERKRWH